MDPFVAVLCNTAWVKPMLLQVFRKWLTQEREVLTAAFTSKGVADYLDPAFLHKMCKQILEAPSIATCSCKKTPVSNPLRKILEGLDLLVYGGPADGLAFGAVWHWLGIAPDAI